MGVSCGLNNLMPVFELSVTFALEVQSQCPVGFPTVTVSEMPDVQVNTSGHINASAVLR